MVSFKQLSYALAVEKTLHFKQAAQLCHISQSALSTGLTELEKQLGLQIFERDNKKVLITPIGKEVLKRARTIMVQVDDLQSLSAGLKEPLSFPLSVGVIPTIAPFLLPGFFTVLEREYPKARLNIVEEQSHVLVEMVRSGEIDAAILALPFPCDGLMTFEFWQEDFYWVAPRDDDRARMAEITGDDLRQSKLMLLKDGHCLKDHVLDVCKLPEQTANHGFGATSLTTLVQMVSSHLGTTLVPEMALDQLVAPNPGLAAVHLDEPGPHRRIAFVIRPNYTRLSSVEALIEVSKTAFTALHAG